MNTCLLLSFTTCLTFNNKLLFYLILFHMTLLQKTILQGAKKTPRRRAGRRPTFVNGGWAAGLATASVKGLTEAVTLRKTLRLSLY